MPSQRFDLKTWNSFPYCRAQISNALFITLVFFPPSITNVPDRQLLNQNQTTKLKQNQKATQDGEKAWTLEYGKVGNKALSYQE